MNRSRYSVVLRFLALTVLVMALLCVAAGAEETAVTAAVTAEAANVKPGKSFEFSYEVTGSYDSLSFNVYSSIPNDSAHLYVLKTGTLTAATGSVKVDRVHGDDLWMELTVTGKDGKLTAASSIHVEILNIRLGKSGWVRTSDAVYYGDEFGYAVTGLQWIEGGRYFFNEDGVLQTGWVQTEAGKEWNYTDSDGKFLSGMSGFTEITIPAKVDKLSARIFAGVNRDFFIRCEAGSYAEEFARKHGFQYITGERTVLGSSITDASQKADWIVSNYISSGMSEKEKALVLHNWLIYNAYYDLSYSIYTADGVLVKGTGVCDSYSKAYSMLLDKAGIENKRVTGVAKEGHAWNLVRVGGQWYHVDCTWDDPTGGPETAVSGYEQGTYFLKGDAFMRQSRTFDEDFSADANYVGFVSLGERTYYYGKNGQRATGWTEIKRDETSYVNGAYVTVKVPHWYYFDETGLMKKGWLETEKGWYYLAEDGVMQTGSILIGGKYYHFDENGIWHPIRWVNSNGYWFCCDEDGVWRTGWVLDGKNWYYVSPKKGMLTGWNKIGGSWYCFNASGAMQTGWLYDGGAWFFLGETGAMQTGWIQENGKWYYMNASGVMQTGWKQISSSWYYFSASGVMQTGWITDSGAWYYLRDSGAMLTGWMQDGDKWYYLEASGPMATGWEEIQDKWEFFDPSGVWQYTWNGN